MDLLIGIAIGSIVTNITQYSNQCGGTVPEEIEGVDHIIRTRNLGPRVERFIKPYLDRVQPQTNDELRKMVKKWCKTPDVEKPLRKDKQHISNWDTSRITDMSKLFENMHTFNDDISRWNTSKVTNMSSMFKFAKSFNQSIGNWETSKET